MKSSQAARSKSMEIDRRMRALAWTGKVLKLLLAIATARVENSEAKILRGLRRHCLPDQRPEQLFIGIARRYRCSQKRLILVFLIGWFDWYRPPDLHGLLLLRRDRDRFPDRFNRDRFPNL